MRKTLKSQEISDKNKDIVAQAFLKQISSQFGEGNVSLEKIMNKVEKQKNVRYIMPDYFLHIKNSAGASRTWSLIIKVNFHDEFREDQINLKSHVVWTCKNRRSEFPNPYLVASISTKYKLIPFYKFWFTDPVMKEFPEGEKKVFQIDLTQFEWIEYDEPLDFVKI